MASLLTQKSEVDGVKLVAARVRPMTPETLRDVAEAISTRLGSVIVVLGTVSEEKPFFLVTVSQDLTAKGYHAGNIITPGGGNNRGRRRGQAESGAGRRQGRLQTRRSYRGSAGAVKEEITSIAS